MEEIEINGKKYVLKSSIKQNIKPKDVKVLSYCIIRTYSAGVFAGWVNRKIKGKIQTIYNCRRLWYWKAIGLDCSSIAEHGILEGSKCSEVRSEIDVTETIEIQPCTEKSRKIIEEWITHKNE